MSDRLRAFPDLTWENLASIEIEDRRRNHEMMKRQVTPQLAQRTADLSFAYPQVAGGVVTGMAQAGITPFSSPAEALRQRSAELADAGFTFIEDKPGFWDVGLGRQVKGFTRGAFTLFQSIYDEVVKGGSAFIYGLGQGKDLGEAAQSSFGYSTGAIALSSVLQGRPANLGSGFFPGGDLSPETQAALDRGVPFDQAIVNKAQYEMGLPAAQTSLEWQQSRDGTGFQKLAGTEDIVDPNTGIRGLTLTPGRFVAAGVTEPGTWAFNQLSGVTDFAANIYLDPTNALGGALADIRSLNRSLVGGGARTTVLKRNVDDWLASGHGDRVAQFLAETDDYHTLHGLFRKNATESNVDSGFIYALQQANDPVRVKELLSTAVNGGSGAGQLRQLPVSQGLIGRATGTSGLAGVMARGMGFSGSSMDVLGLRATVKANRQTTSYLGRMGAEVGAGILRFDDVSTAVDDLGQWLTAAGVDKADISRHMSQMASIAPGQIDTSQRMWGAFKAAGHTVAQRMIDNGLDKEIADSLTRSFSTLDDYRKFWQSDAGNPMMFTGSRYSIEVNGVLTPVPTAQLLSEFMDMGIPLPDMRKIRKGLRRAAWVDAGFDVASKKIENVRQPGQILPRFKLREMEGWEDLGPGVLTHLTDTLVQKVWKPLVLLRVAWPVRVVAEEQVRMGAVGLDSAINHPLHWLGIAMGRKMADDIAGNPFEEASKFIAGQSRKGNTLGLGRHARNPYSGEWIQRRYTDPEWWDGLAINIQQLADDPLTAHIAKAIIDADEATSIEAILKPIKDAFSDSNTELGRLRDALAADSSNWGVVNVRELADAVIDDRYARLVHMTGGDVVRANHIDGQWADLYGNRVVYRPEFDDYWNTATDQVYTNLPSQIASRPIRQSMLDPATASADQSLQSLFEAAKRVNYGDAKGLADSPDDFEVWEDALDQIKRTLDNIDANDEPELFEVLRRLGGPDELLDYLDRFGMQLATGDPNAVGEFARMAENFSYVMQDIRGLATDMPPSGRASFRAAEMIEIAGDPDLLRARFAGYVPGPGQPTLDEIAGRTRWSTQEVKDMIGPRIGTLDRYKPHPIPDAFKDSFNEPGKTYLFTEPTLPDRPNMGETTYIARDGKVVGYIQVQRDAATGRVTDIGMLKTAAKESGGKASDSGALVKHVMKGEGTTEDMYDLAFGGNSIREWMQSAGVKPEGFTLNDMAEWMREQYGAQWAGRTGPLGDMPSIALSNDGATALATQLIRDARLSQEFDRAVASWPQAGITAHAVRPGRTELIEGIANGSLDDISLSTRNLLDETEKPARISAIADSLRGRYAEVQTEFPNFTKTAVPQDTNKLDNAVDHLFNLLGSRPTNFLSRSPAFKQFYYKRVGEMLPYVDNAATRDELVKAMQDAGMRRADIKAAQKNVGEAFGELTKQDIDDIAKAFALQETKRLLYDLTKKTQFFDITRNIFPFGEAWYEIITTWGRIINENPQVIRRIQQGIQGARQEGIFYNDPATGEEVFAMPHIDALASLMGVSAPDGMAQPEFTGRVDGVNLVLNSFLPGVGPVVQMPVAALGRDLMDKPEMRWARDLLYPFGYPETGDPGALVNSVMPAWFKKALTAMGSPSGDDQRLYNNTIIDVIRAMELNGEITPQSNPTEVIELARSRARSIYFLRFAQQFIGPTGAQVRWDVKVDPKGEAFAYQVLAGEYRQMIEDNNGDRVQAFNDFVNMYGFDPAALATAKTEQVRPRAVTSQGLDFQQQNPELFEKYGLTAYYVAPDPPDGAFDYNAYLAQLRSGDRVGLTPEQWLTERNRLLGSIAYEKVRRVTVELGVRNEPRVAGYLRAYRYNLMEQYPGYGFDNVGVVSQPEQYQFMAEFEQWRTDPQLMATNAGQGLDKYLEQRDLLLAFAETELGVSREGFANAKSTSRLREYLLNAGQRISAEYPDFGVIFQRHYLWEVETPEVVAPTELLGVDLSGPDTDEDE